MLPEATLLHHQQPLEAPQQPDVVLRDVQVQLAEGRHVEEVVHESDDRPEHPSGRRVVDTGVVERHVAVPAGRVGVVRAHQSEQRGWADRGLHGVLGEHPLVEHRREGLVGDGPTPEPPLPRPFARERRLVEDRHMVGPENLAHHAAADRAGPAERFRGR